MSSTQSPIQSAPYSSSTTSPVSHPSPHSSSDPPPHIDSLLTTSSPPGHWILTSSGTALERTFRFKTFKTTWAFMNAVADECKRKRHHPEWSNVYNVCFMRWTTHVPKGLSEKDVEMARFCDETASGMGALVEREEGQEQAGVGRSLADRVVVEGADCCTPKM